MIIAVIPARGGSKRIRQKNIRSFCGRPIMQYSIDAAIQSEVFDRIIVSTDCEQTAEVAVACGAEVPFMRPAELADDFVTTSPVIQHAVTTMHSAESPVEYACCIYAASPFTQAEDIRSAFALLKENPDVHFALPVTTFPYSIFRSLQMQPDSFELKMFYPKYEVTRSQDLPEAWHDAAQFYWGTRSTWERGKGVLSSRVVGVPVPRHRVQDIDTEEDWERAELMFELLTRGQGG